MIDLLASLTDEQAFFLGCAWTPYQGNQSGPLFICGVSLLASGL